MKIFTNIGICFSVAGVLLMVRGTVGVYDDVNNITRVWSTKEVMHPAIFIFCMMLLGVMIYCIREHLAREKEHAELMRDVKWVPIIAEKKHEVPIKPNNAQGIDLFNPEMAVLEWDVSQEEAYTRLHENRGAYSWIELEQIRQEYIKKGATQLARKIHDNLQYPWRKNKRLDKQITNPQWGKHLSPTG